MTELALPQPFESVSTAGDNALIAAYLEGNERAFEVLVKRYQAKLTSYINLIVRDREIAVDLAQEAFIRVYRNAGSYRGEYQFSTWLYRIATNLAIDEMRRRTRGGRFFAQNILDWLRPGERAPVTPDTRHSPDRRLGQKEQMLKLQRAIHSLPEKYRLAFILREVQEFSYEEAAEILKVSPGTAKSRVHRAKTLLREKLAGVV